MPSALNVNAKRFDEARVNGGSNNDSLTYESVVSKIVVVTPAVHPRRALLNLFTLTFTASTGQKYIRTLSCDINFNWLPYDIRTRPALRHQLKLAVIRHQKAVMRQLQLVAIRHQNPAGPATSTSTGSHTTSKRNHATSVGKFDPPRQSTVLPCEMSAEI